MFNRTVMRCKIDLIISGGWSLRKIMLHFSLSLSITLICTFRIDTRRWIDASNNICMHHASVARERENVTKLQSLCPCIFQDTG